MHFTKKAKMVFILGIAVLAMLILSLGLSQIDLQQGEKSNLNVDISLEGSYGQSFNGNILFYILDAIYILCVLSVLGYLIYMLLTPERRKKLFKFLAWAIPIFGISLLLVSYVRSCSNSTTQNVIAELVVQPTSNLTPLPTVTFSPNNSPWIIIVTSAILAIIISILIFILILYTRREQNHPVNPLLRLADQAQVTLDSLHSGGDLRNAVLRCYFEMNRILSEQRSLKRVQSMTPREFEMELLANGLPEESIKLLTRLFEEVRYGSKNPGQREEWMAETSLTAIIEACKSAK